MVLTSTILPTTTGLDEANWLLYMQMGDKDNCRNSKICQDSIVSLASSLAATTSTNILEQQIELLVQFIENYHSSSSASKTM